MKILRTIASSIIALLLLTAIPVLADQGDTTGVDSGGTTGVTSSGACAPGQLCNPIKATSINQLVSLIMKAVIDIGSIVAVFFVIWAGLKFVQARGNPEAIAAAQKTLMYTLIGIAVLFGAQLIAALITNTVKNVGSGVIQ